MLGMVSADMGVVKGIAGGFCVDCQGMSRLLGLPLLDHGMDGIEDDVKRSTGDAEEVAGHGVVVSVVVCRLGF